MLVEGWWIRKFCRRFDGLFKKCNIMLFEVKLIRVFRIIWELMVVFLVKCSNDFEIRIEEEIFVG